MATRIPLIIVGDGPRLASGLARIARDLTARLLMAEEEMGIRVAQVGIDYPTGWHWTAWPVYGFQETKKSYGRSELTEAINDLTVETGQRPIVWLITDPSRCFDFIRTPDVAAREVELTDIADFWGYFPIDSHNPNQAIGGPALETAKACQRVIGYGEYGARVLKNSLGRKIAYLPHGLEPGTWTPTDPIHADRPFQDWLPDLQDNTLVVGAVATNQPRKDLGLYFASMAHLRRERAVDVFLWLHTDFLTHAWDIGQLAYDFGFDREHVFVSTNVLTDTQLAARYSASHVTVAPGLGEGFGYPIVESLGCGTPVVHGRYAGGVELIPNQDWLVAPFAWRLESCYVLERPVFRPEAFAETVYKAYRQATGNPHLGPYCAGSVRHLWWDQLWPRWQAWITKGLTDYRAIMEAANG